MKLVLDLLPVVRMLRIYLEKVSERFRRILRPEGSSLIPNGMVIATAPSVVNENLSNLIDIYSEVSMKKCRNSSDAAYMNGIGCVSYQAKTRRSPVKERIKRFCVFYY